MSAYDYVANAILYLPSYILTSLGCFFAGALSGLLSAEKPRGGALKRFFVLPGYFYVIWCIIFVGIILSYFLSSPRRFYEEALLIFAFTLVIAGLTVQKKEMFPVGQSTGFAVVLAIFMLISIFAIGLTDGYRDLSATGDLHLVEFKPVKDLDKATGLVCETTS
jgi:hypothetical protein